MTTYLLSPSASTPFQFQPTLGKNAYNVLVTWNIFANRYYVNILTLQGALVYCMPLIASPPGFPISLLPQFDPTTSLPWMSSMYFDDGSQSFVVTP